MRGEGDKPKMNPLGSYREDPPVRIRGLGSYGRRLYFGLAECVRSIP
jgi:hypothetical protein